MYIKFVKGYEDAIAGNPPKHPACLLYMSGYIERKYPKYWVGVSNKDIGVQSIITKKGNR